MSSYRETDSFMKEQSSATKVIKRYIHTKFDFRDTAGTIYKVKLPSEFINSVGKKYISIVSVSVWEHDLEAGTVGELVGFSLHSDLVVHFDYEDHMVLLIRRDSDPKRVKYEYVDPSRKEYISFWLKDTLGHIVDIFDDKVMLYISLLLEYEN